MSKISTSDIKKLRDLTGAGFLDCKEALEKSNSIFDDAIQYLRKKGISTAEKKGDRSAKEGLISISKDDTNKKASIIEVNSETDFVARNEDFQKFVSILSKINLDNNGNLDDLMKAKYDNEDNVSQALTNLISKIGENLNIRRTKSITSSNGYIGTYVHNIETENMGKIGVLISVDTDLDYLKINDFLKKICMHIAALNPIALSIESISKDILNKEKKFQIQEIKKSGKDQNIQEKMLEGKMNKFFNEVVLFEQNFVMDDSVKIRQFIENISKELNGSIEIKQFIRFKVGESI